MAEKNADGAAGPPGIERSEMFLTRRPSGGFTLEGAGQETIRVVPCAGRLRVEGRDDLAGWSLSRGPGRTNGFVVRDGSGTEELAWTAGPVGLGREAGLRYLLLDDGRLFRIVLRGPREPRIDLLGWETSGAYIEARPDRGGWRLVPRPASVGLEKRRALFLVLAAEILDWEEPLQVGST